MCTVTQATLPPLASEGEFPGKFQQAGLSEWLHLNLKAGLLAVASMNLYFLFFPKSYSTTALCSVALFLKSTLTGKLYGLVSPQQAAPLQVELSSCFSQLQADRSTCLVSCSTESMSSRSTWTQMSSAVMSACQRGLSPGSVLTSHSER